MNAPNCRFGLRYCICNLLENDVPEHAIPIATQIAERPTTSELPETTTDEESEEASEDLNVAEHRELSAASSELEWSDEDDEQENMNPMRDRRSPERNPSESSPRIRLESDGKRKKNDGSNPLEKPPLTFRALCVLAALNTPDNTITSCQARNFVLHHFAHYRYAQSNWGNNVSAALSRKPFTCVERKKVGSVRSRYLLVEMDVNNFLNEEDWIYMKEESRREFFERMLKGELGLPRQFFYTNVVRRHPRLAGPENSALFYHLLGMKIVKMTVRMFKEYNKKERIGIEPKHVELVEFDDEEEDDDSSYGKALEKLEGDARTVKKLISAEYIEKFHGKVEEYFKLQLDCKQKGDANWATPSISKVKSMLDCDI
ncbi:unnamed protein product [Caenorhabditis sp. 36 PRJEB53466]|nr:unnamed protein product [Caenorhabditis sp. 36 PRJEB53466]